MEEYTSYEVLKDILSNWDISELYYFDFYKFDYTVRYGRKGYDYERKMNEEEFNKLLDVIKILEQDMWIEIYENPELLEK